MHTPLVYYEIVFEFFIGRGRKKPTATKSRIDDERKRHTLHKKKKESCINLEGNCRRPPEIFSDRNIHDGTKQEYYSVPAAFSTEPWKATLKDVWFVLGTSALIGGHFQYEGAYAVGIPTVFSFCPAGYPRRRLVQERDRDKIRFSPICRRPFGFYCLSNFVLIIDWSAMLGVCLRMRRCSSVIFVLFH